MTAPEAPAGAASCRAIAATADTPGAIGIIQLLGPVEPLLAALTGIPDWPAGRTRLVDLGGVDEGVACRTAPGAALLMPHGGPRVRQRLLERLAALGAPPGRSDLEDPAALYPEAHDGVEALVLWTLARARSRLAVDLLLDQPRRWRGRPTLAPGDVERSRRLNRLVDPPTVVLAGPPNVGKSTLSNALLGRSMSITLDAAGTTRDVTRGLIDLAGLVVHWHDTPGLRTADDPAEREAIDLARDLLEAADLVVAMTDATHDWPRLPRPPALRVGAKADLGPRLDCDLAVSALTGQGLDALARAVRDRLVPPADLADPGPWLFDPRLPEAAPGACPG